MTFLEKLDILMKGQDLNKNKLSQISGVPYTTIDGFYKKGYENAQISTVRKIAQALGCSLDYLIEDDPQSQKQPGPGEGDELQKDVEHWITLFREIPVDRRKLAVDLVEAVLFALIKNTPAQKETQVSVPPGSGH